MVAATPAEKLLAQVLALSLEDRIRIAYRLLDSDDAVDPDWTDELDAELDRIEAEIESGTMKTVPWPEVRKRIRERLDGNRDSIR